MAAKKRILVTGAGGFAGFHVAEYLAARGHDVLGVARTERRVPAGVEFKALDLAGGLDAPGDFDVIVHAAGLKNGLGGTVRRLWRNNVLASANVLDFAVARKVPRLIFFSSSEVFGDGAHGIVDEDSPVINPNPYAVSKYAAELLLRERDEVKTVSLRLPGIVGPGASGIWLVNMIGKLAVNAPVTIHSPEFETANFVHLDDLAGFVEAICADENMNPPLLALACRQKARIIDLVEHARAALNSRSEIRVGESEKKPYCLNAAKAFRLGYEPKSPIEILNDFLSGFARNG